MFFAFRIDSSYIIGAGHFMRCMTLAAELRKQGHNIHFLSRNLPGNCIEKLCANSYTYSELLPPTNSTWFVPTKAEDTYPDWQIDAELCLNILNNFPQKPDFLVVDNYGLDEKWENILRTISPRIFVIDDLANRKHNCDILLDQNYFHSAEKRYSELVPQTCQTLLGPKYALLRPEFAEEMRERSDRGNKAKKIFLFMGMMDNAGLTPIIMRAISSFSLNNCSVEVVAGNQNPHIKIIKEICSNNPMFNLHINCNYIAKLMAKSTFAIGAGGSTTWERCAMSLPAIIISTAKNQEEIALNVAEYGAHLYLGINDETTTEKFKAALSLLMNNNSLNKLFSTQARSLVDGVGCARVAATLINVGSISLRRASEEDCETLFNWRNHPITRKYSLNNEKISFEFHKKWFENSLRNPNRFILIAEKSNEDVGVLRYDLNENDAIVSIYLDPNIHGKGMGSQILLLGSNWVAINFPNVKTITAEVLAINEASFNAFLKAGYNNHQFTLKFNLSKSKG